VFSGQLLLELAAAGAQREEAYYWVQRNALNSWDNGLDFRELVTNDPDISRLLNAEQIERAFDVRTRLRNIDRVFERVFGK
jgi:adenylosuccinate lyase